MLQTKTIKTPKLAILANLDLTRELNDAAAIVKTDIQKRYADKIDLDGSPTAPLAESTIASKLRSKNPKVRANAERPLIATENMWRNQKITKATKTNQTATIEIGPTRDEIYTYHHEGTANMPARPKFGIGEGVDAKIDEMVIRRVEGILARL